MRLVLVVITAFFAYGLGAVVLQNDQVQFNIKDNQLAWPLPDVSDPGLMVVHGMHCLEQLRMKKGENENENMTEMHQAHCRNVVSKILHLLESNPSYKVNGWICDTLREDGVIVDNGLKYGINYDQTKLLEYAKGIGYGINYDNAHETIKPKESTGDNGLKYGINYDQAKLSQNTGDNGLKYGINYDQAKLPEYAKGIGYGIDYKQAPKEPTRLPQFAKGIGYGINYNNAQNLQEKIKPKENIKDNGLKYGINYDDQAKLPEYAYGIDYKQAPQQEPAKLPQYAKGIGFGINYKDVKNLQEKIKPKENTGDNGLYYVINYNQTELPHFAKGIGYGIDYKQFPNGITEGSQREVYVRLMAFNFGNLLMKNWIEPATLTSSERAYLKQWEQKSATAMGAISVYCGVNGNLEAIRKILD